MSNESKKPEKSSLEMFNEAFHKSMVEDAEEAKKAPKVFDKEEGVVDVVDDDDKHMT